MNRNSLLISINYQYKYIVYVLSYFAFSNLVLCKEEIIQLKVCSFIPEEPLPTAVPNTVSTRPTYSPITLPPATPPKPTYHPIPTIENGKESANKRLLSVDYYNWPKKYDDIQTTSEEAMNELMVKNRDKIGDKIKLKAVEITFNSTEYDYKVFYELNYTISISDDSITNEEREEWHLLKEKLEKNKEKDFYEYFSSRTENVGRYGVCILPQHLKKLTPCKYGESFYLYSSKGEKFGRIYPIMTETGDKNPIGFTLSCSDNYNPKYLSFDNEKKDGIVIVNTIRETSYSVCIIQCLAKDTDNYRKGYSTFASRIADNRPIYSEMGSSFPKIVSSTKNFTISLKLLYPSEVKLDDVSVELSFQRNENCAIPNSIYGMKPSGGFITFFDLSIYCESDKGKLIDVLFRIIGKNINGLNVIYNTIKVKPIIPVKEEIDGNKEKEPTLYYDLNYATEFVYFCEGGIEADVNGLCCERDINKGETCSKLTMIFPFEVSKSITDEEWILFAKSFADTLRRYVFDKSNFFFRENYEKNGVIEIEITFYEFKIWLYSYNGLYEDSELVRRRSLQSYDINWKLLSSPYIYINTLLSFINPTLVPEIQGVIDDNNKKESIILESIPPELREFLKDDRNIDLKKKIIETAEILPQKVVETIGRVVEEINIKREEEEGNKEKVAILLDINDGIKSEEIITYDAKPSIAIIVTATSSPTASPFIPPELGTGGEDKLTPSPSPKKKNWAEENWWVILLICIGAVLIIGIVVAILVVSLSRSGSSGSGKTSMEIAIPIDKIKQENEISDDKRLSHEVIMEGYLLKEDDETCNDWKRSYFVLYSNPAILRIYDSMTPSYYGKVYIDEKQSIPLDCYNGIEYKDGSNEFILILKGEKERKIHLKVEGENGVETAKKWVKCFETFKN